jgi:hypothetical protein
VFIWFAYSKFEAMVGFSRGNAFLNVHREIYGGGKILSGLDFRR